MKKWETHFNNFIASFSILAATAWYRPSFNDRYRCMLYAPNGLNNINGGTIFIDGDCFVVDYGFVYHYCIIHLAEMASVSSVEVVRALDATVAISPLPLILC